MSFNAEDLKALIERAKRGEKAAFAFLIEEFQSSLFRFCFYLSRNRIQAEDVCQSAFLKAFEKIKNLEKPAMFKTWLFQIARNEFIDQKRTESRQEIRDIRDSELTENRDPFISEVREALGLLSKEFQICLLLVDLEGHSYMEAAGILGITEDAVRSRLHRARKEFIAVYEKDETLKPLKASTQ